MTSDVLPPAGLRVAVVMPCYNEAARLDLREVETLLHDERIDLIFVDDGSTDETRPMLDSIRADYTARVVIIAGDRNRGKAEAVRTGAISALGADFDAVGYLDADFATPAGEFLRLVDRLSSASTVHAVMGSRVALLGTRIDRRMSRHYLGRVFASAASFALNLQVYDTQCGAKVFRNTPALHRALSIPFRSRWIFDVELISRLTTGPDALAATQLCEVPLQAWRDVGGSKLTTVAALGAARDLLRLLAESRAARPRAVGPSDA